MRRFLLVAFLCLFATGLVSCAARDESPSPAAAGLTAARAKLSSDLEACTAAHGYDPHANAGIAENALAPGELDWRACAYNAARTYARANPAMRLDYELLIRDDQRMTEAIQQGAMTRTQRRAEIEARIAELEAEEQRQSLDAAAAAAADQQQLRNTVESLRGFAL